MAMFITGPGSPFAVGTNPVSNATADLDGDGHLDLVFANYISDNVSVLLGDGDGGFTAIAPVTAGNGPREIEVGDLDGDGDIDFLATNYSGNSVTVALNNGSGSFVTSSVAVGTVPRGLAVGDLDGDGDLDFVSANYGANTVSVMLNNGSGAFSNATGSPITVGTRPTAVVVGNFDGDADLDIAVTSNNTNTVSILRNNGNGTFAAPTTAATGVGPRGISGGDFDGDGDFDLVVDNFGATSLSILINNGSGTFVAAAATLATGNNPYAVTVGDLDGDGDLDIATTNSGSSSVSVFLNNGSATFTAADGNPFAVGVSPGGIVMGDFDEDGRLDLSTANFGSNSTSILINTDVDTPPTAVTFSNVHGPFAENASTAAAIKVADITVVDADNGPNILSLAGGDAAQFQIIGGDLWLKAGAHLDFETNPVLNITVNVNAPGVGGAIDASRSLAIPVNNVTEPINGTDAPNFLFGTPSGETISGLGGNDRIIANAGNDRIVGGLGADVVTGGAGSDVFAVLSIHQSAPAQSGLTNGVFDAAAGQGLRDIITDFAPGVDKLDLSTMDARTDIAGNQGFNWRGAGDFTGVAGQLIYRLFDRVDAVNDKTIIYGDVNGDSRADFQVQLTGLKILTVGDLIA